MNDTPSGTNRSWETCVAIDKYYNKTTRAYVNPTAIILFILPCGDHYVAYFAISYLILYYTAANLINYNALYC